MKLVLAIVQDDDAHRVVASLMNEGFSVTKISSTGGFLRLGNTTLILGVNDDKVGKVVDIVESVCHSRKQIAANPTPMPGANSGYVPYPMEVVVGGATIFVLPVESFKKI